MTCLSFCEHLDTLLAGRKFSLDLYAVVILKKFINFFQFFSAGCYEEHFCHILAAGIFKKIYISGFSSCFDGVILAEIVISGSQFMTKFDQFFLSIIF